jgi:hypothetical protein
MKRLIVTILAAGALMNASAQLFSPESLNGALLGTFIGGIAGANHHHGFSAAANPGWGHQIADAPVVPDAPRF